MLQRFIAVCFAVLCCTACSRSPQSLDDFNTRPVTLPDGAVIRAETLVRESDVMRGMMFRTSLPPDRGLLFVHGAPSKYTYWMYQVNIPLDIIWMDKQKRVVEVVANAQPCKSKASECTQYGGNFDAMIVLELNAGQAAKHGIKPGSVLSF